VGAGDSNRRVNIIPINDNVTEKSSDINNKMNNIAVGLLNVINVAVADAADYLKSGSKLAAAIAPGIQPNNNTGSGGSSSSSSSSSTKQMPISQHNVRDNYERVNSQLIGRNDFGASPILNFILGTRDRKSVPLTVSKRKLSTIMSTE